MTSHVVLETRTQRKSRSVVVSQVKLSIIIFSLALVGCAGKYTVRSYPTAAKVYVTDLQSNERRLAGISPLVLEEQSKLGDVFFIEFEKDNYRNKKVLIKINEGESLTVSARLDPVTDEEKKGDPDAAKAPDDQNKPQGQPPQKKDDEKALKETIEDLNLRVALLENTVSFYKDAMFSPRFQGGPAKYDRDRSENVIGLMFEAQRAIVKGDLNVAESKVDSALQKDEYLSNGWLLKGSIKYLQKDWDGARSSWERCLEIDPHNKIAYNYLNKVYQVLGVQSLPEKPSDLRFPASNVEIERRRKGAKTK